ncbi:ring-1,2-phenylacetyl-CoA epoxidase subunit PaaE [Dyadobacter jejuensis]|uniref:Ring-1,2-phenylacetyl-CoA epoxidase subunit PaaE n=1 Tax=Dyadobacter jejuensis TaxID=1082580 RepID=A0A316AIW7_9BACT|nr:iron-sulfur cluster-binding domain-containing protein [Dyadobacter jejuensis]PWJ57228.1 ring-1,2-phenylacetyl-CoA epoxidase subunit PaaE [Dyadobacter jejuensis]
MTQADFQVTVVAIQQEDALTKTFLLRRTDGEKLVYSAGQFLTFLFNFHDQPIRRSYSFSSAPQVDTEPAITIRRVENGTVSRFWFQEVKVGDCFDVLEPAGRFVISEQEVATPSDLVLVGAGSGMTPLFSILKHALVSMPHQHILMISASRNEKVSLFSKAINQLAIQYPARLRFIEVHSQPTDDWQGLRGRLNNSRIQALMEGNLRYPMQHARFFLCGPKALMRTVDITLRFMAASRDHIRKEHFIVPSPPTAKPVMQQNQNISIVIQGRQLPLFVPAGSTILDAAAESGLAIPYSCKAGSCGICAAQCSQGKVYMAANEVLTDHDLADHWVLTCTGYPLDDQVVLKWP